MAEWTTRLWWISIFGDAPQPAEVRFRGEEPQLAFVIGSANPIEVREMTLVEEMVSPAGE